jgi:hypothetical protein
MAQKAWRRWAAAGAAVAVGAGAQGQVPDIISVFDAGSRAMALGGSTQATDITPNATLLNPAGLGYITAPTLSIGLRSLPDFDVTLSGSLNAPDDETDRRYGRNAFTQLSYAQPFGRGALGFSFSVGSYGLSTSSADFLTQGNLAAVDYRSSFKAQTDFFTLGYGQDMGRYSWGLGVIYANQYLSSQESYQIFDGFNQVGTVNSSTSGNATGVGAVAGVQAPIGDNAFWGASVRSPISLDGNDGVSDRLPRIPGKASAAFSVRRSLGSRSGDSLLYAAQADYHFGGSRSARLERKDGLGYGLGVEYSLNRGGSRWPIRLGYSSSPSLGEGFDARRALTFGLGWRPQEGRLGVDLGFMRDLKGGPYDISLGLTYRLGD